jgi:hypothetical protein
MHFSRRSHASSYAAEISSYWSGPCWGLYVPRRYLGCMISVTGKAVRGGTPLTKKTCYCMRNTMKLSRRKCASRTCTASIFVSSLFRIPKLQIGITSSCSHILIQSHSIKLKHFSVRFHLSFDVRRRYTATYGLVVLLRKVCEARQEVLRLDAEDILLKKRSETLEISLRSETSVIDHWRFSSSDERIVIVWMYVHLTVWICHIQYSMRERVAQVRGRIRCESVCAAGESRQSSETTHSMKARRTAAASMIAVPE